MSKTAYYSAAEAAEVLGISLPTLYSYVSRGLLRSEVDDASKRTHRYLRADVEALRQRREQRRNPTKVVEDALYWGAPLLDSALTHIADGRCYYRGHDVTHLAVTHSLEAVAGLIWCGDLNTTIDSLDPQAKTIMSPRLTAIWQQVEALSVMERFQILLPLAAVDDLAAYNLQPEGVTQTGGRILRLMAAIAAGRPEASGTVATILQQRWAADEPDAAMLINAAMVLSADHELNVSSFTARCVASAGSMPYQVVSGGLAALLGARHGRVTEGVMWFLREVETPEWVGPVVASRLKRGEPVPGFGHPLYPGGDPRARRLLELVEARYGNRPQVAMVLQIGRAAAELVGKPPTIDFALVALARALNLPANSPIALFALGRTVGWIGHALETYEAGRIIRPRANYVGPLPEAA
jgi:citrate synthase